MVEIRNYQNSDYSQVRGVLELTGLYWDVTDNEKSLNKHSEKDPSSYLVAVDDGRIVGTQFIVSGFTGFLFRLAVHPEYQRRGIGSALQQKGKDLLRERGYDHAVILVDENNKELQAHYEKLGYKLGHVYRWMTIEL